jgi:DNA replication and repair protein RecF
VKSREGGVTVRVSRVIAENFRNLRNVDLDIPPEGSFVVGLNGQGKTNFLEAIYYLGTIKSFRSSRDAEMLMFGEAFFRICGEYEGKEKKGRMEVAYDGKRKVVKVNGVKPDRISEAFGTIKVVVVTPDDVEMIQSYPAKRRRFMDIVISMTSRKYLRSLTGYHAVLRQRNMFLRERQGEIKELEAWDNELGRRAAEVTEKRWEFAKEFARSYEMVNRDLAGENESTLTYTTNPGEAGEALENGERQALTGIFDAHLKRNFERDRELGRTTVGPHRDDLVIGLNSRNMRTFGSQGQQRTSVFALRMSEARYIEEKTGERPVILMDDVFSQLDRHRGERLMGLVRGVYQTIISTPRLEDIAYAPAEMSRISVEEGSLKKEK